MRKTSNGSPNDSNPRKTPFILVGLIGSGLQAQFKYKLKRLKYDFSQLCNKRCNICCNCVLLVGELG